MDSLNGYPRFLNDTAVTRQDEFTYLGEVTDAWSIGGVANGGYSMAIAARALSDCLEHKDPLSITGHYLSRAEPGPVILKIEKLSEGRSITTAVVRFIQRGKERIRFTASFTDFLKSSGDTLYEREPLKFPPISECIKMPYIEGFTPILEKQIDRKFTPTSDWWNEDRNRDKASLDAYYSWPAGEQIDLFSLVFFLDTMTPPVFNRLGARGWVPSIELTIHLRAKPVPGPVLMRGKTDFVTSGFLGEDDEIWDAGGNIVAEARQMAKLRMPKK
jgi:acyl-CoA thioesterase